MPQVELTGADAQMLRDAAAWLREGGNSTMAERLEALANYVATVIRQVKAP
jgi:hypothetical protein